MHAAQQSKANGHSVTTDIKNTPPGGTCSSDEFTPDDRLSSQVAIIRAMGMPESNDKNSTNIPLENLPSSKQRKQSEKLKETLLTQNTSAVGDNEETLNETSLGMSKHHNLELPEFSKNRTVRGKVGECSHDKSSARQRASDDRTSDDDVTQKQERSGILRKSRSQGRGKGRDPLDDIGFVNKAFDSEDDIDNGQGE